MKHRRSTRPRVLVLGGGFAGLAAALALRPDRHEVTLVDRSRWFEFLPNIHELVSGVKTAELLRLPLDRSVERAGHAFVRDTVTGIDPAARRVSTRRRRSPFGYDALIVALGEWMRRAACPVSRSTRFLSSPSSTAIASAGASHGSRPGAGPRTW